jgi:hypothetical protein
MAQLVFGAATSHAVALMEPTTWDQFRTWNRELYARRYGTLPPEHPRVAEESDAEIIERYQAVRYGHDMLRDWLREAQLDALIFVGDDQNENFTEELLPQLAIYLGEEFRCSDRIGADACEQVYPAHAGFAWHLYEHCIDAGFDLVACRRFPDGRLKAHAVGPVLARLIPDRSIPVVPLFVEAIHYPAISPARCYQLGQALRAAVESWAGGKRVGICASGGLSHFTAGYPYAALERRYGFGYGDISIEFDHQVLDWLRAGDGAKLASLTSRDLLEHGEVELRSWIVLAGMVGRTPAQILAYEPFYRGLMGMGVAAWQL